MKNYGFFCLLLFSGTAAAQEMYPKETETFLLNYAVLSKNPTTAYWLSAAPGFGAGHFYADDAFTGMLVGAGQGAGLGLFFLSGQVGEPGDTAHTVLSVSGLALFGLMKVLDMVLAPMSVEQYNKNLVKRLKIKPVVSG